MFQSEPAAKRPAGLGRVNYPTRQTRTVVSALPEAA
jgi:hypothetical protein